MFRRDFIKKLFQTTAVVAAAPAIASIEDVKSEPLTGELLPKDEKKNYVFIYDESGTQLARLPFQSKGPAKGGTLEFSACGFACCFGTATNYSIGDSEKNHFISGSVTNNYGNGDFTLNRTNLMTNDPIEMNGTIGFGKNSYIASLLI